MIIVAEAQLTTERIQALSKVLNDFFAEDFHIQIESHLTEPKKSIVTYYQDGEKK